MVVAKRNARERTRVHTVNQAFLVLKQHLPSLRQFTKRVSKLRILNAAITYIETLLKLIQSSETVPQSVISATLGPIVPTPVRATQKPPKHSESSSFQPLHSRPFPQSIVNRQQSLIAAPIATCAPDHSLVDYRSTLSSSFAPVPVQMPSVFSPPQPSFPYMKSLLEYPTYFYQPSTAPLPPPPPPPPPQQSQQSHLIVNQLVSMPTYQCF